MSVTQTRYRIDGWSVCLHNISYQNLSAPGVISFETSMKEQGITAGDINKLYRQVESTLEALVDKLLISQLNVNDNILQSVQSMMEKIFITSAMKISNNNISQASKLLGINRNTLSKKIRKMERLS